MTAAGTAVGVSRQQIWAWYSRRDRNGFPAELREDARGLLFDLDEVIRWHEGYVPQTGGRPRKETA